ncbi:MAG: isocitrate lyase/phosphoenolpyruvate mutase family protein [Sulfitobacter sp.]
MTQSRKAHAFKEMHSTQTPVVLYNIWDAGGAKAIVKAGSKAVATGSWSIAAAHGFADGEAMPLDFVLQIVARIVATVDVPVTMDFEGGYGASPEDVAQNAIRAMKTGAVGINFEDQVVQGHGLYDIAQQTARLKAIRQAAVSIDVPLFINARTDLFLGSDPETHSSLVDQAIEREAAYATAGADGFFIPGLTDIALIEKITAAASLPVNVMAMGDIKAPADIAGTGVSRFSYGPAPYFSAASDLKKRYSAI